MNLITTEMAIQASTLHNDDQPTIETCITIAEAERILSVVDSAAFKSRAIDFLEAKIADLEAHNVALQAHNTELLTRARKAEALVPKVGFPLQVAAA